MVHKAIKQAKREINLNTDPRFKKVLEQGDNVAKFISDFPMQASTADIETIISRLIFSAGYTVYDMFDVTTEKFLEHEGSEDPASKTS